MEIQVSQYFWKDNGNQNLHASQLTHIATVVPNLTSKQIEEMKSKEKLEERKQIEFSEKIDELNQETDTLLEEIDKWEM